MDAEQTGTFGTLHGSLSAQMTAGEFDIPMLPEIAMRVVTAANDPVTSSRDMARIILADPALAAHVMRVVRSAAYRPQQPIESLHHAISWLGMGVICELAVTAAMQGRILNIPGQRLRAQRLWNTAVGTAAWSRLIAEACGRVGEASYLAGLMHEVGVPVCLQAFTDLARQHDLPLCDRVLDELVASFKVEVGGQVARRWGLPAPVIGVVSDWADWASASQFIDQCAVTYLAHHLAEHTLAGSEPLALALADDPVTSHLGLTPALLKGLVDEAGHVRGIVEGFKLRPGA